MSRIETKGNKPQYVPRPCLPLHISAQFSYLPPDFLHSNNTKTTLDRIHVLPPTSAIPTQTIYVPRRPGPKVSRSSVASFMNKSSPAVRQWFGLRQKCLTRHTISLAVLSFHTSRIFPRFLHPTSTPCQINSGSTHVLNHARKLKRRLLCPTPLPSN
jgi:hypothetical protein